MRFHVGSYCVFVLAFISLHGAPTYEINISHTETCEEAQDLPLNWRVKVDLWRSLLFAQHRFTVVFVCSQTRNCETTTTWRERAFPIFWCQQL